MATLHTGLALGCGVAAAYALQYARGGDYWLASLRQSRTETHWISFSRKEIADEIHSRYTPDVPPSVFRILVLGASQTWGAGARRDADTWVRQLEKLLNDSSRGRRVECVNAGVSGFVAGSVLEMVRNDLADIAASAALVNLSSNDIDTKPFEQNLDALAAELSRRNVPT